jgi:hypothetical protein
MRKNDVPVALSLLLSVLMVILAFLKAGQR